MSKFTLLMAMAAIVASAVYAAEIRDKRISQKFSPSSWPAFHAKFIQKDGACTIISMNWVRKYRGFDSESREALIVKKKAAFQPLADTKMPPLDSSQVFNIYGRREDLVRAHVNLYCLSTRNVDSLKLDGTRAEPEVRKIADGGDQANRVDVVFMGDGYTAEERDEFFDDMARLTKEMFEGVTFRSYLPLFNIWAIYVESVESGIGYDGPKDTPFQLYRESGQLRGIYPGNPNYAYTVCDLTGQSGCDYPSLIGNDDYYGGLGGDFVISTRSNRTGTVVLRHEMGHNFVDVGEEYDNGYVYSGVNAAYSVNSLGWGHWLSGEKREERAMYRLLEYPWADLSQGQQSFSFTSDGSYSRWYLLTSVSAAGEADSLEFVLDGEVLPWQSTGYDDREFYSWNGESGFSAGTHTLTVRSKTASQNPDIPRMICSVNLHEFGSEDEFHMDNEYVSAYPTWDYFGGKTFRPTNAGCLMRNMTHNMLCNVCREGMWYEFFRVVDLIDEVTVGPRNPDEDTAPVTLSTLQVAHLRPPGNEVPGEELRIRWYLEGVLQESLTDLGEIQAAPGNWRAEADFITPEVLNDPNNLLKSSVDFVVTL